MKQAVIYMIKGSHGIYIGETLDIETRFRHHKNNQKIAYELMGVGVKPAFTIITELPSTLNKKQRLLIEKEWSKHFAQFNTLIDNTVKDFAWKNKIRLAHIGKRHSDDCKAKISEAVSGENNPFYGRTHTQEAKEKIGASSRKRKYK